MDDMDSAAVTKRLEEELKKRDTLIEVSSPSSKGQAIQSREVGRTDNTNVKGPSRDVATLPFTLDKTEGTVALVKSSPERVKTTPAVKEYLRKLGCFALRLRLLLRLWVEKLESWMRGDHHVSDRTSIRESIDGTLGGKMRLGEFEGKLRQFVGILREDGEKGFGL
ncbi:kinesin KCA2 [Olea europaea subsp. europaea]|uniref:Kinesin KCA2 n=1 Tax=Olea europaea subsp. europaea TaxID=158383 RepID=A0A8S0R2H3_OLEEU|nr:kinesin KCA2 [Olea europaea subsp. europaea]